MIVRGFMKTFRFFSGESYIVKKSNTDPMGKIITHIPYNDKSK